MLIDIVLTGLPSTGTRHNVDYGNLIDIVPVDRYINIGETIMRERTGTLILIALMVLLSE